VRPRETWKRKSAAGPGRGVEAGEEEDGRPLLLLLLFFFFSRHSNNTNPISKAKTHNRQR
jgi:hypothetical protein